MCLEAVQIVEEMKGEGTYLVVEGHDGSQEGEGGAKKDQEFVVSLEVGGSGGQGDGFGLVLVFCLVSFVFWVCHRAHHALALPLQFYFCVCLFFCV